jgi:hypothetical protein
VRTAVYAIWQTVHFDILLRGEDAPATPEITGSSLGRATQRVSLRYRWVVRGTDEGVGTWLGIILNLVRRSGSISGQGDSFG